MRFEFSVLLFHPDFGEDSIFPVVYAKDKCTAWRKLYYQLNKAKLLNYVVSLYLRDEK